MKRKTTLRAILILIAIMIGWGSILPQTASAQRTRPRPKKDIHSRLVVPDSGEVQVITLDGGTEMTGRISEVKEDSVVFETDLGTLTIPKAKIRKIKTVRQESVKESGVWFPNPNQTRLFFTPTARMLEKGDGYFADYYIFFPSVAYGLTKNITVGAGMSIFPGVDMDKQAYFFTPKIGFTANDRYSLAAAALIIQVPDIEDIDVPTLGLLYGLGTYGHADASITAGLGFGFANDEISDKPLVIIGGEKRIRRSMSLVTENWIVPEVDNPVVSYGLRFFGERLSVDLAFATPLGDDFIFPGVPWIDFVVGF